MNIEGEDDTLQTESVGDTYDRLVNESGQDSAPADDSAAAAPQPGIEAPQHWPAQDRELFGKLPPENRTWLLDRYKSMEGDYYRKLGEYNQQRRQSEADLQYAQQVRQLWSPLAQRYGHAQGLDEAGLQRQMAAYASAYYNDPKGFAKWIAAQAGVELPQEQDQFVDPQIAALQRQNAELARQQQQIVATQQYGYTQAQQLQAKLERDHIVGEIETFKGTKDSKGALVYPHFEVPEVKKTIGALMAQYPEQYGLHEAYQAAVRMMTKPQETPQDRARRAKLAASGINGGGVGSAPPKETRVDFMKREFDRLSQ